MNLTSRLLRYVDNRFCLRLTLIGWMSPLLRPSSIRISTVHLPSWRLSLTRSFLVSASSSSLRSQIFSASRLQPSDGPVFRFAASCTAFGFCFPPISCCQMRLSERGETPGVCRLAPFLQFSRISRRRPEIGFKTNPSIYAPQIPVVKRTPRTVPVLLRLMFRDCLNLPPRLLPSMIPTTLSVSAEYLFAPTSHGIHSTPSTPIQDLVFHQFLHDVHHA